MEDYRPTSREQNTKYRSGWTWKGVPKQRFSCRHRLLLNGPGALSLSRWVPTELPGGLYAGSEWVGHRLRASNCPGGSAGCWIPIYVKSKDSIEEEARKVAEIKDVYQEIVAAVALRTIHEVLNADQADTIAVVVFNGFVNTADPATGKDIKPYLISVRVTKERFIELELGRIDKKACLRNLGALVSSRAAELLAVKPLIEFDMVDKRFVEAADVLAGLESRPNLMDVL